MKLSEHKHESSPTENEVKQLKSKSLMATFAIVLVALSTVGFAYSAWKDSVKISATANMGEFIVGILTNPLPANWTEPVVVEETTNGWPEAGPAPGPLQEGGFDPKPWVANTTVTLDCYRTSVHHDPVQTVAHYMYIYVDNAYPQYDAHIKFLLKNAGTIPAHIRCLFVNATVETETEDPRPLVLVENGWAYVSGQWVNSGSLFDPEIGTNGADVINWYLVLEIPRDPDHPEDVQLEPCNHYPAEIHFDFKQEAEECHTYRFKFVIDAIQWNMDWEWNTP